MGQQATSAASNWWDWWVSQEVMGVLGWLGLVLTVVGFAVTLYQVHKAATAAESAKVAVAGLKVQVAAVSLAYVSAQLNTIHGAVQTGRHELAQSLFLPLKRTLRLRASSTADTQALSRAIKTLDTQLAHGIEGHADYKVRLALRAIDAILTLVTAWEHAVEPGEERTGDEID